MSEYEFRVIPETPMTEEDRKARQLFESYGADVQSGRINVGIGIATGALAGGAKGSIPGAFIGAVLGGVAGFWKWKSNRMKIYAQLDAMGLLKPPRIKYRGVFSLHNAEFVFVRYAYAEQTALVIIPILQKYYPYMTDAELTQIGQNSQLALIKFRKENKDIPLALAADVILAFYGVVRDSAGNFDLFDNVAARYMPPPSDHVPTLPTPPHEPEPSEEPNYWLYGAVAVGALILLTR